LDEPGKGRVVNGKKFDRSGAGAFAIGTENKNGLSNWQLTVRHPDEHQAISRVVIR
jgi:hypothetical protein